MSASTDATRCCWLQVSIGGEILPQKVVLELDTQRCPKTCQSFVHLCAADGRTTPKSPQPTFRGCDFHRIIPKFMVQAGDFERFDGTGGYSPLWGKSFPDENLQGKHDQAGVLSMANSGKHTNESQFFITLQATPHLDGKHVVFGRVIAGMDSIMKMTNVERDNRDRPVALQRIVITDCGVQGTENDDVIQAKHSSDHRHKKDNKKKKKKKRSKSKKRKRYDSDHESTSSNSSSRSSRQRKSKHKGHRDDKSSTSRSSSPSSYDRRRRKKKHKSRKTHGSKRRSRDRSPS